MRRGSDRKLNLDSLLDTLTNVVGFLIILLAVMQINVSHGVSQVQRTNVQERIQETRRQASAISRGLPGLRSQVVDATSQDTDREEPTVNIGEISRQWNDSRRESQEYREQIGHEQAKLAQYGDVQEPVTEELSNIRLLHLYGTDSGDPRPEWVDKQVILVICRGDRAFRLNAPKLVEIRNAGIDRFVGESTTISLEAWEQARSYFEENDLGTEQVRIRFGAAGLVRYEFRSLAVGDRSADIESGQGALGNVLRDEISPADAWVRCLVWDDSFAIYTKVCDLVERLGYRIGWIPYGGNQDLQYTIGAQSGSRIAGPHE